MNPWKAWKRPRMIIITPANRIQPTHGLVQGVGVTSCPGVGGGRCRAPDGCGSDIADLLRWACFGGATAPPDYPRPHDPQPLPHLSSPIAGDHFEELDTPHGH